jgi:hypothetical protein
MVAADSSALSSSTTHRSAAAVTVSPGFIFSVGGEFRSRTAPLAMSWLASVSCLPPTWMFRLTTAT